MTSIQNVHFVCIYYLPFKEKIKQKLLILFFEIVDNYTLFFRVYLMIK